MPSSQQYSQTVLDASNETSHWEATIPVVTAISLPQTLANLTTLEGALTPIIRGNVIRKQADVFDNTFARSVPADEEAARETKWLVVYHDVTSSKTYRVAIPTCKRTGHMLPGTDMADLNNPEISAFVDAFEAAFRAPDDSTHGIEVDRIIAVGRNL